MSLVTSPSYTFDGAMLSPLGQGVIGSVLETPIVAFQYTGLILTDPVMLGPAVGPHTIPVPIPNLPGLDEIEVANATFSIAGAKFERTVAAPAKSQSAAEGAVTLGGVADGQTVSLTDVTISKLSIEPVSGVAYALSGGQTVYWYIDDSDSVSSTTKPDLPVQHLHVLVRPGTGHAAGPPLAAAPYFKMPGDGGDLYGPALGGAGLTVSRNADGTASLSLRMSPPQPMDACSILIGTAAPAGDTSDFGAHRGLPNEVRAVSWSASAIEGVFDQRPVGVTVTTSAGATDPENGALVAEFQTDPGAALRSVDFAPAARAVLVDGYPTATGDDLGMALRVDATVDCAAYLQLGSVAARFVKRPDPTPASLSLQGIASGLSVPVPLGLRPSGLSFRIDGRYGPARLIGSSDEDLASSRQGYRLSEDIRLAQRVTLSPTEQTLPLVRVGVFGRSGEETEVMLTRHGGDAMRIGPALDDPTSLSVAESPHAQWHVAEMTRPALPPHPEAFWLVLHVSRGTFWWHSDLDETLDRGLISRDNGATWANAPGRALNRFWVEELDPGNKEPIPLYPLSLAWTGGVLNGDLVGVGGGSLSASFTRLWVAEGAENNTFLDEIAALDGLLNLSFDCRRDVELSVADVALTYDPWTAGGGV